MIKQLVFWYVKQFQDMTDFLFNKLQLVVYAQLRIIFSIL